MRAIVAEKIQDFFDDGVPEVFDRDLDLGPVLAPARGNLATVVTGIRRCGKTYRLFQEMHRIIREGHNPEHILYFNFEDARLKPYSPQLLSEVLDTFFAMRPSAKRGGAFLFFDEVQEVPEWGAFLRRVIDTEKGDALRDGFIFKDAVHRVGQRVSRTLALTRAVSHELFGVCAVLRG